MFTFWIGECHITIKLCEILRLLHNLNQVKRLNVKLISIWDLVHHLCATWAKSKP